MSDQDFDPREFVRHMMAIGMEPIVMDNDAPIATRRPWLAIGNDQIIADGIEAPIATFTKTEDRDLVVLAINSLKRNPGMLAEWTCGHVAGSMCAQCWQELAATANKLAEENLELRQRDDVRLVQVQALQRALNAKAALADELAKLLDGGAPATPDAT